MSINLQKWLFIYLTLIVLTACGKKKEEVTPVRKDVVQSVFASGILEAENTYTLTSKNEGYLKVVHFEEGDMISKENVLAEISNAESNINATSATELYQISIENLSANSPSLIQAQNNVDIAKIQLAQDSIQYKRYQELVKTNSVSQVDYENVELKYVLSKNNYKNALKSYKIAKQQAKQAEITSKAQKNLALEVVDQNKIIAWVGGKIYKLHKEPGEYIKRGEALAIIGNSDQINALVNVDESNIGKIKLGQEAVIKLNPIENKIYKGKVSKIDPMFDEVTQSFLVTIAFSEPLDFKIINTQLQVNIITEKNKQALLIPTDFIDYNNQVQVKGEKHKTKVELGFVGEQWAMVKSGIKEKDIVVKIK